MYDRRIEELLELTSCFLKAENALLKRIFVLVKKLSLSGEKEDSPSRGKEGTLG